MAVTAAMTLSSATCKTGESVTATLTLTNSNAEAVEVVEIRPRANPTGTIVPAPVLLGQPTLPAGSATVAASGTGGVVGRDAARAAEARVLGRDGDGGDPGPRHGGDRSSTSALTGKVSDGTTALETTTTLTVSTP